MLCHLDTDEQRKIVLDGVLSGRFKEPGDVLDCVLELAGFGENEESNKWTKKNESDQIWWLDNTGVIGEWIFSFDRVKEFDMFQDYPYKLTKDQKEIFDRENPYWANFFRDRSKN